MAENNSGRAQIDFVCTEQNCGGTIQFDLADAGNGKFSVQCRKCGKTYEFDGVLLEKFRKLEKLIEAVRDAESIIGNCNVAVTVPGGEVKIPYALLLTKLNTMISMELEGKMVDFHLLLAPLSPDTFR